MYKIVEPPAICRNSSITQDSFAQQVLLVTFELTYVDGDHFQ
jgi:hypothetical protein